MLKCTTLFTVTQEQLELLSCLRWWHEVAELVVYLLTPPVRVKHLSTRCSMSIQISDCVSVMSELLSIS